MNTPTASQVAPTPAALPEGMSLRADLSRREVDSPEAVTWHPAGQTGVRRRLLDRQGGEVARATSVVRYDPGARFPAHRHGGGEEILVLQGTFEDEHGRYPAGTWLRNPCWSEHTPFTGPDGAVILVKTGHLGHVGGA